MQLEKDECLMLLPALHSPVRAATDDKLSQRSLASDGRASLLWNEPGCEKLEL